MLSAEVTGLEHVRKFDNARARISIAPLHSVRRVTVVVDVVARRVAALVAANCDWHSLRVCVCVRQRNMGRLLGGRVNTVELDLLLLQWGWKCQWVEMQVHRRVRVCVSKQSRSFEDDVKSVWRICDGALRAGIGDAQRYWDVEPVRCGHGVVGDGRRGG